MLLRARASYLECHKLFPFELTEPFSAGARLGANRCSFVLHHLGLFLEYFRPVNLPVPRPLRRASLATRSATAAKASVPTSLELFANASKFHFQLRANPAEHDFNRTFYELGEHDGTYELEHFLFS
jgi:hypothetical protein